MGEGLAVQETGWGLPALSVTFLFILPSRIQRPHSATRIPLHPFLWPAGHVLAQAPPRRDLCRLTYPHRRLPTASASLASPPPLRFGRLLVTVRPQLLAHVLTLALPLALRLTGCVTVTPRRRHASSPWQAPRKSAQPHPR